MENMQEISVHCLRSGLNGIHTETKKRAKDKSLNKHSTYREEEQTLWLLETE